LIKTSDPTLHVYYGLRQSVIKSLEGSMGMKKASLWQSEVLTLLQQQGVVYHGSVNHNELSYALSNAGFILYPTRYPETRCITIMRAMALGAIPITSSYIKSALVNLTVGFDLGPHQRLIDGSDVAYEYWLKYKWAPSVIAAASVNNDTLIAIRQKMKLHARSRFSWKSSAETFSSIFHD
jgi:protein O-GlcNAc transferase